MCESVFGTLRRWSVPIVCAILVAAPPAFGQPLGDARTSIMRAYLAQIPVGSRVRVTLVDGERLRGVLMLLDGREVVIKERTRIPEPPRRIQLDRVAEIELDRNGGQIGKAILVGAGAGAAAALGVFLIILAALGD